MKALVSGFTLLISAVAGDVYIVDGDTLVVSGTHVGLAGVDAPAADTAAGEAARTAMRHFTDGKHVTCRVTGSTGGWRRSGVCYADGQDVGAALITQGYALDCPRTSDGRYRPLEPAGSRSRLPQAPECSEPGG